MEDFMTIRIKHRDKTSISIQQANIRPVATGAFFVSQASYTALEAVPGVLYGSI